MKKLTLVLALGVVFANQANATQNCTTNAADPTVADSVVIYTFATNKDAVATNRKSYTVTDVYDCKVATDNLATYFTKTQALEATCYSGSVVVEKCATLGTAP